MALPGSSRIALSVISNVIQCAAQPCACNNAAKRSGNWRSIRSRAEMLIDTFIGNPSRRHVAHCAIARNITHCVILRI